MKSLVKMKKSKSIKFLKITAIGFLLLFVFIVIFLKYRNYKSYQQVVHANADIVIKVNVDQLIKKTAIDYLFHKPEDKIKDTIALKSKKEKFKGFSYPANLFLINLKDNPSTFITSVPLNDTLHIASFLNDKLKINSFSANDIFCYGKSKSKKVQVAYNNQKLVIAYSQKKKDVKNILEDILLEKNVVKINNNEYHSLKNSSADIIALKNKSNKVEINFNSGNISLEGSLEPFKDINIPTESVVYAPNENAYIYGWFTGKFNSYSFKDVIINDIELPLDSLFNHYTKSVEIEVAGTELQRDTIITYEYDDDFEKVEVLSFQEKKVPGINIQLNGNAENVHDLLKRKLIINDNKVNSKLFPLYSLNTFKLNKEALVLTNSTLKKNEVKQKTDFFFHLNVNVTQLVNELKITTISKYMKSFKNISISANTTSNNKIHINGDVQMDSDKVNALLPIIYNQ